MRTLLPSHADSVCFIISEQTESVSSHLVHHRQLRQLPPAEEQHIVAQLVPPEWNNRQSLKSASCVLDLRSLQQPPLQSGLGRKSERSMALAERPLQSGPCRAWPLQSGLGRKSERSM